MKVCKEQHGKAMALDGSEGRPSHIYSQLFTNAKHNVGFRI